MRERNFRRYCHKVHTNWRGKLGLIALVLCAAWPVTPAFSQQTTLAPSTGSAAAPRLKTRLAGFPISVGPSDALKVSVEVTNSGDAPVDRLEVLLLIYQGIRSVSELQRTYGGFRGRQLASDTIPVDGAIEPGQTRTVEVAKSLGELSVFRNSTVDRPYPVRIVVRAGNVASEPIDTYMIFFTKPPEKPLGIGLVVPLHSPSAYTDGARPEVVTSDSLERSIQNGRLSKILDALERRPDLPVTLAPSGLLLSMLQDMADGYLRSSGRSTVPVPREDPRAQAAARTLGRLRSLASRPNTRIITSPYSPTSLPALNRFNLQDLATTELAEGKNALLSEPVGLLRSQPMPGWLLPTGGRIDQASFTELQKRDFSRLILSSDSLRPSSDLLTRGLPVKLEGGSGSATEGLSGVETTALVADAGLSSLIAQAGADGTIEARQRFAALTATIHLETPGRLRAVLALAPNDWKVRDGAADGILSVVASAPWLRAMTPQEIVSTLDPPADERLRLAPPDTVLEKGPPVPGEGYFSALAAAGRSITRYAGLAPPATRLGNLSRRLLIAQSTDWWSSRSNLSAGLAFAEAISPNVTAEMRRIRAPAPQTITLTSRTGVIPLSVGSALSYPVDVVIRLDSDKLRFPDGRRINIQKLRPPNQTIRVRAITQASGTFPLKVQVLTPGGVLISDSLLTVRSTAYNLVALWITGAAAAFLIGWWMTAAVRRRLHHEAAPATPTSPRIPAQSPAARPPAEPARSAAEEAAPGPDPSIEAESGTGG